jgi:hypothetical protein
MGPNTGKLAFKPEEEIGGTSATYNGPVFAPVELERLARLEDQRHKGAAAVGLLFKLSIGLPRPHIRRDTAVGSIITQSDLIGVHLFGHALLLARQAAAPLGLPKCHLLPKNASDVLRSVNPCRSLLITPAGWPEAGSNMGQISVLIYAAPGSLLSGNQRP